jgi:predicted ATPase with chaperone activity
MKVSDSSGFDRRNGRVTISRAAGTMTFPSEFMLVAARNPTA